MADAPLLNEYKLEFVLRRLPQTLLGGLNLKLGYEAPFYVYVLQIVVWLVPWVVSAAFTLATELGGLSILISSIVCGSAHLYFAYHHSAVSNIPPKNLTASQNLRQLLADDDEILFLSCFSFTTFNFVIPPKKPLFRPNILFHSVFSGLLCGFGVFYTLPSFLASLYNTSTGVAVAIYIFSWVSICIAQYPLTAGGVPPEVAVYRSVDPYELASLSRCLHICIVYAMNVVLIFDPRFQTTNQVLHILLLFLPLVWLYGLLPPTDALIFWLVEQLHVFALGGSPMATGLRLMLAFFLSGMVLLGASFIASVQALVIFSAAFGFVLSTDVVSFILALSYRSFSHFTSKISLIIVAWHIAVLAPGVIVAIVVVYFRQNFTSGIKLGFQIAFIALYVVGKVLQDVQKVYFLFGIFRNCLYPTSYTSMVTFMKRKKILRIFGFVHFILSRGINPLLMTAYLSAFLLSSSQLPSFFAALVTIHAYRVVWQRSNNALLIFSVVAVVDLISSSSSAVAPFFSPSYLGERLLVADIFVDRVVRFVENLWFACSLLVSSYWDTKQRRKSSLGILIINLLFFPIVLGTIGVASILSAPLLPLFTLPIFLVGFPRHSAFWPQTPGKAGASTCADTVYYAQMAPEIAKQVATATYLGSTVTIGSCTNLPFFLVRSQDKSVWIQTLESGYSYASYSVKGLELQETSCHALEATRLDDACQAAFEPGDQHKTNPFPLLSSVTPVDTVYISSYSDAKNSLTGIIDNPKAIQQYHRDFVKSMVWLLIPKNDAKVQPQKPNTFELVDHYKTSSPHPSQTSVDDILSSRPNSTRSVVVKNARNTDGSTTSLGSLLSSEDRFKLAERNTRRPVPQLKPPGLIDNDEDWENESGFSDSGFGLPALQPKIAGNTNGGEQHVIYTGIKENLTSHVFLLIYFLNNELTPYLHLFDRSWYLHVTSSLDDPGELNASGMEEDKLMEISRSLVLGGYFIVNNPTHLGASHLGKVFMGDIPWSPQLDWLEKNPELYDLVLQAHRVSIKLMYDRVAMGTTDLAEDEDFEETMTSLRELQSDWFIGVESSADWKAAVEKQVPSLFSLSHGDSSNSFSARVLTRRPVEAHITHVSPSSVRSIWSNLSMELLYATNDDEERFSIQAHQSLIRNLTVQAADPPLGYPIFSSKPMYVSTL
uniref:Pecanex-like protein n=1 Tax=Ciona savignyi TaxID=51511 RepID=H2Z776_CIOSA